MIVLLLLILATPLGASTVLTDAPNELNPDQVLLVEEVPLAGSGSNYNQAIQLERGWNLVSFNVLDDPNPIDPWWLSEIFTDPWFDPRTDGSGPDKVYEYRFAPPSMAFFPCTSEEPTWSWLWQMEWAYMIHLDDQYLIELAANDWYVEDVLTFTPTSAWDDSLDDMGLPPNYIDNVNYWFFLGFSKSRQVEVLPTIESDGPFFDLYDPSGTNYGNRTLKVVKSDDGRCFFPNSPYGDIDRIGYLEPGRGYSLGFVRADEVSDWPFCVNIQGEESIGGGGPLGGGQAYQTASLPPEPVHFQFRPRTQWWYPILLDTLAIEGVTPETGDEIGVFDGNLCVGAVVYTSEMPLVLPAWKDDISTLDTTDGYAVGNEMIFKYFDQSANAEIIFQLPPEIQAVAEEDPNVPRHSGFGMGVYALRSLAGAGSAVNQLPQEYSLGQNYPNPFNAETIIPIELPQRSNVKIELYNVRGQSLGTIYQGIQNAGVARIRYDGAKLPSGVYLLKVSGEGLERGGEFSDTSKILVLK